ncbi:MAG: monovalent cation/H+ antiporter subunit D family protein [Verrucomicrobiaceae bacterium]|nr:monovalent cation/H+ antiporter subunit D family protein [Verrucomicrobiaceae bacterium]
MEIIASQLPLFACLASLLAVIPILLFRKTPNLREAATIGAGALKLAIVLTMLPGILEGKVYEFTFFEAVKGVPLAFRVDSIGMLFALVASSLWILTSFYAIGYMRGAKEAGQTRFFCFFAISLSATLGVAFAANLFTLYVFYEMLSLATYPLVTHHQDKEARSGGRTYLTYLLSTSIGFALPAMLFCYFKSGESLTFTETSNWAAALSGPTVLVLLLLFVFGFAKAGVMPLHSWLPNAMVAPTPVSALLHAVAVVKVGVFSIIRVFTGVFGMEFLQTVDVAQVISWIAAFTVLTSSLIALTQDNLKRRLAFSTIGQLSYIVLGVSLLTPLGVTGSLMHIAMHAFGKITLFFCAGAIYVAAHKKYVSELVGIGRVMPFTMGAFAIGSLSVIGLPVTGGLVSKWYLVMGTVESGQIGLLVVFLISSMLNAAYFLPIVYKAFFLPPPADSKGGHEAPLFCLVPLCITACLSILFFFWPNFFLQLAAAATGLTF